MALSSGFYWFRDRCAPAYGQVAGRRMICRVIRNCLGKEAKLQIQCFRITVDE